MKILLTFSFTEKSNVVDFLISLYKVSPGGNMRPKVANLVENRGKISVILDMMNDQRSAAEDHARQNKGELVFEVPY